MDSTETNDRIPRIPARDALTRSSRLDRLLSLGLLHKHWIFYNERSSTISLDFIVTELDGVRDLEPQQYVMEKKEGDKAFRLS